MYEIIFRSYFGWQFLPGRFGSLPEAKEHLEENAKKNDSSLTIYRVIKVVGEYESQIAWVERDPEVD